MNREFNVNFYEAANKLDELYKQDQLRSRTCSFILTEEYPMNDVALLESADDLRLEPDSLAGDLSRLVDTIQRESTYIVSTDAAEEVKTIIDKAKAAGFQFGKAGIQSTWPYQLQLLCNAYISEKAILDALLTEKPDLVNLIITKYYEVTGRKASVEQKAEFNDADAHTKIYTSARELNRQIQQTNNTAIKLGRQLSAQTEKDPALQRELTDTENKLLIMHRSKCDIKLGDLAIEVKVAKGKEAKGFHDADVVLICNLNDQQLYIRIRKPEVVTHVKAGEEKEAYTVATSLCSLDMVKKDLKFVKAITNAAIFTLDA